MKKKILLSFMIVSGAAMVSVAEFSILLFRIVVIVKNRDKMKTGEDEHA